MSSSAYKDLQSALSTILGDVAQSANAFTAHSTDGLRALLVETTLNAVYMHISVAHDLCLTASSGGVETPWPHETSTGGPGVLTPKPNADAVRDEDLTEAEECDEHDEASETPSEAWVQASDEAFNALDDYDAPWW